MILNFIQRLFNLNYRYEDIVEQQRAQRLLYLMGIVLIISGILTIILSIPNIINGQIGTTEAIPPIVFGTLLGIYYLMQRKRIMMASYIFVTLIFIVSISPIISNINTPLIILTIFPIILGGVLLGRRALMIVTLSIILIVLRDSLFGFSATRLDFIVAFAISSTILASGIFLAIFINSTEEIIKLASQIITQTRHLNDNQYNSEIEITQQTLITDAIILLRSQLNFNYIRVIILDDDHTPLQTYYSSIGVEQVAESSTFTFANNSAFQQAINTVSPTFVTRQDAGNLTNHLLPLSNAGVIIPAQSLNQTIALFDIQAESAEEIQPETIAMLNLFIKQVTANLIYHRTVNALRSDIREQQTIIERQRQQLQAIQHLQTEGIITDWESYLHQRGMNAIGYDIDNKRQISDLDKGAIPDDLRPAFEKGETVVQIQEHGQLVTIPIRFRDTILGAISFTIPEEIPMTDRKLEFISSVTDRLALALDNKRLLEQTQTQAKREGVANNIGSILLTSTDVQTVLQTAADQFNEALGAVSTQIYLQPMDKQGDII